MVMVWYCYGYGIWMSEDVPSGVCLPFLPPLGAWRFSFVQCLNSAKAAAVGIPANVSQSWRCNH